MSYETMVEKAAEDRGDEPVPRDFISEAVRKIFSNEAEVRTYPTGGPSLTDTYELALKLYLMDRIYAGMEDSKLIREIKDIEDPEIGGTDLLKLAFVEILELKPLDELKEIVKGPFCPICGTWQHPASFHV